MAKHVATVHKNMIAPGREQITHQTIDADVMRTFITHAQQFSPTIPASLHNYIVGRYVEKRKLQGEDAAEHSYMYVTPRYLLGIIRLSQAMARLNFRHEVTMNDVDESLKLMDFSYRSLRRLTGSIKDKRLHMAQERHEDTQAQVMQAVRQICKDNENEPLVMAEIHKRMQKKNPHLNI